MTINGYKCRPECKDCVQEAKRVALQAARESLYVGEVGILTPEQKSVKAYNGARARTGYGPV